MPDLSVVPTVISTIGALLGALGGVALTNRTSARREEAQFRREEAQFSRQRQDQRAEACGQACVDLLSTATQLKAEVEVAGRRHWRDMDVRLVAIQQCAVSVAMHASRVALLLPTTAETALALASAAARLAAATAGQTDMGYDNEHFLGGEVTRPIDFTEFDECIERFTQAAQGSQE